MFFNKRNHTLIATASILVLAITGCSNIKSEAKYPTGEDRDFSQDIYSEAPGIFGKDGLRILGNKKKSDSEVGIAINSYLWRASLDTISFMPLASADPFGGTILTDWYSTPENPNERSKVNIFILDKQLRADGIKVKIFRQEYKNGRWIDKKVSPQTNIKLEDTILTRARQLRADKTFGK